MLNRVKVKLRIFDLLIHTVTNYLPLLKIHCKDFVSELKRLGILSDESSKDVHNRDER